MQGLSFAALVPWVIAHGYFLFFLAALLEGPLVNAAAGVAAALGYFSLPLILLIALAGDLIADMIAYAVGYFGGRPLAERYGHFVGLTEERLKRFESVIHRHTGKALLFFKLSPVIPIPGLMLVGALRVDVRRFIKMSLLISLPQVLFFTLFGFFSGKAYQYVSGTILGVRDALFSVGFLIVVVYLVSRKISHRIAKDTKVEGQ